MDTKQKQKICWNCEGRVSLEEENCPYCTVYLSPVPNGKGEMNLLTPPYRVVDSQEEEDKETLPPSPYAAKAESKNGGQEEMELTVVRRDMRQVVYPLIMLSGGSMCFLIGLMLLFFSEQEVFTLSWNAHYWYFYLGLALPMIVGGWKSLQRFPEDDHSP